MHQKLTVRPWILNITHTKYLPVFPNHPTASHKINSIAEETDLVGSPPFMKGKHTHHYKNQLNEKTKMKKVY